MKRAVAIILALATLTAAGWLAVKFIFPRIDGFRGSEDAPLAAAVRRMPHALAQGVASDPAPRFAVQGPRPFRAPAEDPAVARERAAFRPPLPAPAPAAAPDASPARQIRLANRTVGTDAVPRRPAAPSTQVPTARGTRPYVVQAAGAAGPEWRRALAAAGAIPRGYLPENAWLVEMDDAALDAVSRLPSVRTTVEFEPGDKLQPLAAHLAASLPADRPVPLAVQTLAAADAAPVAEAVRALGGEVTAADSGPRWGSLRILLPAGALTALARRGDVQWIEAWQEPHLHNDHSTAAERVNTSNTWARWGLTGAGQYVGHADTGLDIGATNGVHPDFRGRIAGAFALARTNDWSDPDGHGTHTAGTILGGGAMSGGRYRGAAPGAWLLHQSIARADGSLTGIGADIGNLFRQTYTNGARIHSDSWGSDSAGEYTVQCRQVDEFAWDHPDHLAVFSAGNAGRDGDTNGVIDAGSIGSPASAKNVVAVGATENDRPPGSGGYSSYVYGTGSWLPYFPGDPIRSDYISWSATTNPYAQGMAAFSSRGPTADGRIKPDVTAPGTDVISCRSRASGGTGWGVVGENTNYAYNGGTSMAAPGIAGAAALVRQYAVERAGISNPSAALVKAMLVGGARSLSPGQYGTGAAREIPAARPNSVEGWGQADVGGTLHPEGRRVRLADRIAVAEGGTNSFEVTVAEEGLPLDVALVWIDYPATAAAAYTLVDDLDLEVLAPDSGVLHPNDLGVPDRTNTVETVRFPYADAGIYTIRVIGHSVPETGAVAAVYLRGALDDPPELYHAPLGPQPGGGGPYVVTAAVHALHWLTNGEVRLHWTTNDPPDAWTTTNFDWLGGGDYRAEIPDQPPGATVRYYIDVTSGTHEVRSPADAPTNLHVFPVGWAVHLTVSGTPVEVGSPLPPYGTHAGVSGAVARAEAPPVFTSVPNERWVCRGWAGTGSVPATGGTYEVEFPWDADSTLTWIWGDEVGLSQRSDPPGAVDTVSWFPRGGTGATETAWTIAWAGTEPYAFAQWKIDGARWPDTTSTCPNPATNIVMTGPRTAVAVYLPFWDDANTNNLLDWFEYRYFGGLQSDLVATNDLDGDLWTNLGENLDNTDPRDASSQPTPPEISNFIPLDSPQTSRPPWRVEADFTDNFAIEVRDCIWREEGETTWHTNMMTWVATNRFVYDLNPPSRGSKPVEYYLCVGDIIGYYLTDRRTTSAVHTVVGEYSEPLFDCAPTGMVLELSADAVHTNFTLSNFGSGSLVWTAGLSAASTRIPIGDGATGWSHTGTFDVWHLSTNRVWRGTNSWYCGNEATRLYPDLCHAWLDTPPFHVESGGMLTFRHWIKTEYDSGDHFWDGGVLRVSTNDGASFELITPVGGYPYKIVENPDSPFPPHQPCLAGFGDANGWQAVTLDLAPYADADMILRFEFGADRYTVDEGWYIGEVAVHSSTGAVWVTFEGPTDGTMTANVSQALGLVAHPEAMDYDTEEEAVFSLAHNDPAGQTSARLRLQRGRFVTASRAGPGQVSFERAFLFRDAATSLVVRADRWAHISGVTSNGAAVGGPFGPASTNFTMAFQRPGTDVVVAATFSLNRTTNGVPEAWLAQYGWSNDFEAAAMLDTDEDGHPAWVEWTADTDPTNALSVLRILGIGREDGPWRIEWAGGVAATQYLEASSSVADGLWSPVFTNDPPAATATNALVPDPGPGFFRLRAVPPSDR